MRSLKDILIEAKLSENILTDIDLSNLLDKSPMARYGLVNKAIKKGDLIKLRRGLYLLAQKYRQKKLSKYFLASRLVPHSYISLESALSYHGWIPELVTSVSSVLALGRTKKFINSFGEFNFYQLPRNEYEFLTGVNRVEEISGEPFFLASPLRALADYVYFKKIDGANLDYLINSLRIEMELLKQISSNDFVEMTKVYRSKRVLHFLEVLKQELKK